VNATDELLLHNARFYEAVENADIDSMEELWSNSDLPQCVHPGWEALRGWVAIRRSWEEMFASGDPIRISLRNVSGRVSGVLGIVLLEEEIAIGQMPAIQVVRAVATNIFEHDGTVWRMIHHHSSPVLAVDADDLRHRFN
jgi:SnoaL-like domain